MPGRLDMTSSTPTFPHAGLNFLKNLKRNNNRDWFLANRSVYEESVRSPMIQLVEALATEFAKFAPEVAVSSKSLFRIHRDTRFSADKTPYKTHVAASFSLRGLDRHEGAGFYFHITPTELWIGGGVYRPSSDKLRAIRGHIAVDYERLNKIVKARSFRELFGGLSGEQSSRMPRGYPQGHPAEQYLRHKDLLAARELGSEAATKRDFLMTLARTFRAMHPLICFLNEPILREHRLQERRADFLS
jgi:uncharacterized protein (TIGR02453 family)